MKHSLNAKHIVGLVFLVFASFIFHELAHYLMGTALGYDMTMTLNTVNLTEGEYAFGWHRQLVSAAGPIFTILTAIVCFIFLKKRDHIYIYLILLISFVQRFLAAGISLKSPNDEARISEALGLGEMTLPIIVSLGLFVLVYAAAKKWKYSLKFSLISFLIICLSITAIVTTDQFVVKPWIYS